jgi:putative DNA primase/helicase
MSRRDATLEFDEDFAEEFEAKKANAERMAEEEPPDVPEEVNGAEEILDATKPLDMADQYLLVNGSHGGAWTLRFMGKDWWGWTGMRWEKVGDGRMNSRVWGFLEKSLKRRENAVVRFGPTTRVVGEVVNALKARVIVDRFMPCWTGTRAKENGREWVALQNGLLNLRTRELVPHSPRFWNSVVLPFSYDAEAKCPRWDQFLGELWPEDSEAGVAVEEMLGVCISYETRWHKAWFFKGRERSGKGTIAKVLEKLVGEENFAGMQVDTFSTQFGMEAMLEKKVTCFPDVSDEDAALAGGGGDGGEAVVDHRRGQGRRFTEISTVSEFAVEYAAGADVE